LRGVFDVPFYRGASDDRGSFAVLRKEAETAAEKPAVGTRETTTNLDPRAMRAMRLNFDKIFCISSRDNYR